LDDSREWNWPMELVLGKKFKLEVWETCVQTMALHEVASFKVKAHLAANYPTVAKTLRDKFSKDPKKSSHGHVCGMMAAHREGGLTGYDDLNELCRLATDLEFVLDLVEHQLPEEYSKEAWQLNPKEKLASVTELRAEGNRLYAASKHEEAARLYGDALGRLEQLILREKPQDDEWAALKRHQVPLLLNFSQCKLSLEEYKPVIDHCTEVLDFEPDNVKALFRRGKAHIGAWNPDQAKQDFQRVSELDPSLVKACNRELQKLKNLEKEKDSQDRDKLKNLF